VTTRSLYRLPAGAAMDAVLDDNDMIITGDVALRVVGDGLARSVRILARRASTVEIVRGAVVVSPPGDLTTIVVARVSAAMAECGRLPVSTTRGIDGVRGVTERTGTKRLAKVALSLRRNLAWLLGADGDGTDYPPRPVEVEAETFIRRVTATAAQRRITLTDLRRAADAPQLRSPMLVHLEAIARELRVRPHSLFRPI
jgi:hypothetical protein